MYMYLDDDICMYMYIYWMMYICECEYNYSFLINIPLFLSLKYLSFWDFNFVKILDILTSKQFFSLKSLHEPMNY